MTEDVFICYRSQDEPFAALLVDQWLTERLGAGRVFRDSRTIRPGTYFPDQISRALQHCRALVAVIGSRWFSRGPDGQRLIDSPRDYVRREIATALQRGLLVIPVLVGGVALPAARSLPADIAELASRQYLHLRVRSAEGDGARLVGELVDLLDGAGLRTGTERAAVTRPAAAAGGSRSTDQSMPRTACSATRTTRGSHSVLGSGGPRRRCRGPGVRIARPLRGAARTRHLQLLRHGGRPRRPVR